MANSTILYACTEEGLAIVNKPGTASEWLPPRIVLRDQAFVSVWAETGPPIRVLAATWEGDLLLSETGGRMWSSVPLAAPVAALFEMGTPASIYVVLQNGSIQVSSDGGASWSTLEATLPPGIQVSAGEPVSTSNGAIYLMGQREEESVLLRTSTTGGMWQVLPLHDVDTIARDSATGKLYALTADGVHVSEDAASDVWSLLGNSPADGNAILVIPAPAGKQPSIVVSTPSGLFLSPEGSTWGQVVLPHPGVVTSLASDPQRRDRLYAATATGYLAESGNRGQTWQPINAEPLSAISYLYVLRI